MLGLGFHILIGYLKFHRHIILFKLYYYIHFHTMHTVGNSGSELNVTVPNGGSHLVS